MVAVERPAQAVHSVLPVLVSVRKVKLSAIVSVSILSMTALTAVLAAKFVAQVNFVLMVNAPSIVPQARQTVRANALTQTQTAITVAFAAKNAPAVTPV